VLGGDVLVLELVGGSEGRLEDARRCARERGLRAAVDARRALERRLDLREQRLYLGAELLEQGCGEPFRLAQQRAQQVGGRDLCVPPGGSVRLRLLEGLLALDRQLVEAHARRLSTPGGRTRPSPTPHPRGPPLAVVPSSKGGLPGPRRGRLPDATLSPS